MMLTFGTRIRDDRFGDGTIVGCKENAYAVRFDVSNIRLHNCYQQTPEHTGYFVYHNDNIKVIATVTLETKIFKEQSALLLKGQDYWNGELVNFTVVQIEKRNWGWEVNKKIIVQGFFSEQEAARALTNRIHPPISKMEYLI